MKKKSIFILLFLFSQFFYLSSAKANYWLMCVELANKKDRNPIHLNKKFAQKYDFKNRIVHGMLIGSFYSKFIGVDFPGKYSLILEICIKFNKPVFIGDILTIEGKITSLNKAYKIANLNLVTKNQLNKKVSSSEIIVKLNE